MAVLLHLSVDHATWDVHDDLDARMSKYLMQAGGSPPGLMSHVVYPDGEGFVVADVWRTEAEGRSFFDKVFRPMLTDSEHHFSGLRRIPFGASRSRNGREVATERHILRVERGRRRCRYGSWLEPAHHEGALNDDDVLSLWVGRVWLRPARWCSSGRCSSC